MLLIYLSLLPITDKANKPLFECKKTPLKFITVVRPHEATYRELLALYQTLHKMALFFLCVATTKSLATPVTHY